MTTHDRHISGLARSAYAIHTSVPDTRRTAVSIQIRSTHIFSFHSLYSGTTFSVSDQSNYNLRVHWVSRIKSKTCRYFFFFLMFAVISQHSTKYYPLFVHTLITVSGKPGIKRGNCNPTKHSHAKSVGSIHTERNVQI